MFSSVARHPDNAARVAVRDATASLTFAAVDRYAGQMASFCRRWLNPGDGVGVVFHSCFEAVAQLACWRMGWIVVPLNSHYPAKRLEAMCTASNVRLVLCDVDIPVSSRRVFFPSPSLWQLHLDSQAVILNCSHEESCAVQMTTSGTTGRGKSVQISHRALVLRLQSAAELFPLAGSWLRRCPSTFVDSLSELWSPLCVGGTSIFCGRHDIASMVSTLANGITHAVLTPTLLDLFVTNVFDSVQMLFVSGEPLLQRHVGIARRLFPAAVLVNLYGSTEVTGDVAYFVVPPAWTGTVPVGSALNPQTTLALHPQTREILVSSPQADERLLSDGWLATGDLGRACDGLLYVTGRLDRVVKVHAHRVDLDEIQALIPDFHVSLQDNQIMASPLHRSADADAALRVCRAILPDFAIPSFSVATHHPKALDPADFWQELSERGVTSIDYFQFVAEIAAMRAVPVPVSLQPFLDNPTAFGLESLFTPAVVDSDSVGHVTIRLLEQSDVLAVARLWYDCFFSEEPILVADELSFPRRAMSFARVAAFASRCVTHRLSLVAIVNSQIIGFSLNARVEQGRRPLFRSSVCSTPESHLLSQRGIHSCVKMVYSGTARHVPNRSLVLSALEGAALDLFRDKGLEWAYTVATSLASMQASRRAGLRVQGASLVDVGRDNVPVYLLVRNLVPGLPVLIAPSTWSRVLPLIIDSFAMAPLLFYHELWWGAVLDNEVVGAISFAEHKIHVVVVTERLRGRGIGSQLLEYALSHTQRPLHVHARRTARLFYEHFLFVEVGLTALGELVMTRFAD